MKQNFRSFRRNKDPVSHMCLASAVGACWALLSENISKKFHCDLIDVIPCQLK